MTDPMDPLDALVAAEIERPEDSTDIDAVRARLATTLGAGALAGTGARAATTAKAALGPTIAKAVVLLGIGFGAGFATRAVVTPASPAASTIATPVVSASVSAAPTATIEPSSTIATVPVTSLPSIATASPSTRSSTTTKPRAGDAEAERLLLETARAALQRGDAAGAIDRLREHRTTYPSGSLREERDALMVTALARAGRREEAARAAAQFRKDYPLSLQGAAFDEDGGL